MATVLDTTHSLTDPTVVVGARSPIRPYSRMVSTKKISRFMLGPPSITIIFLPGVSR